MAGTTVFDILADVEEFGGKPEELFLFTKNIDELREICSTSMPEFVRLFDLRLRSKVKDKANIALINHGNPVDWPSIKNLLQTNFNVNESLEAIVNKIKIAEIRSSISDFFDYVTELLTKLNLKSQVEENNWYRCETNEKMVLKIFISKLPSDAKLVLQARNPNNLQKAKEMLIETEYFYKNLNPRNKRNPGTFQPPLAYNRDNLQNNRNSNAVSSNNDARNIDQNSQLSTRYLNNPRSSQVASTTSRNRVPSNMTRQSNTSKNTASMDIDAIETEQPNFQLSPTDIFPT